MHHRHWEGALIDAEKVRDVLAAGAQLPALVGRCSVTTTKTSDLMDVKQAQSIDDARRMWYCDTGARRSIPNGIAQRIQLHRGGEVGH